MAYVSRIMSKNFRKEGQPEKERIAHITGMELSKVSERTHNYANMLEVVCIEYYLHTLLHASMETIHKQLKQCTRVTRELLMGTVVSAQLFTLLASRFHYSCSNSSKLYMYLRRHYIVTRHASEL